MSTQKMITIKRVSIRGHDLLEQPVSEAIDTLTKAMNDRKWVFVDARKINETSALNEQLLVNAETVQISNGLVGG